VGTVLALRDFQSWRARQEPSPLAPDFLFIVQYFVNFEYNKYIAGKGVVA